MDRPRHTQIRRLLVSAFTPRQMARVADRIEANARRAGDDIAELGHIDAVAELAARIPMHNICDMMGVPEQHRREVAHEAQFAGGWRDQDLLQGAEPSARLFQSAVRLRQVATELIEARRRHAADDLLTALAHADVDGASLTDDEIASFFGPLMVAGNDTTRQSITHGILALTDHPEQKAWLLADLPRRTPTAVEEIVRWASPIMTFRRTAARDCELAGQQIAAGDKAIMFYASANWDTTVSTTLRSWTWPRRRTRPSASAAEASTTAWATSSPGASSQPSSPSC